MSHRRSATAHSSVSPSPQPLSPAIPLNSSIVSGLTLRLNRTFPPVRLPRIRHVF